MLLVPLWDPAGVGGQRCVPHPERLIANQELRIISGCCRKTLNSSIISSVYTVAVRFTILEANINSQRHNNARLTTIVIFLKRTFLGHPVHNRYNCFLRR